MIVESGNDYLVKVKANQPKLYQQIETAFLPAKTTTKSGTCWKKLETVILLVTSKCLNLPHNLTLYGLVWVV